MADILNKVIRPTYQDKLITINEFRNNYASGISSQAIDYAIKNDLIDHMDIGKRVRIIVLTEKTLGYEPNSSPKR